MHATPATKVRCAGAVCLFGACYFRWLISLRGGVNSTRPRRKIRLAVTRLVGASFRRLRRRRRQAPAPAASSAKRAVPRPQILTRIAVIEHSTRAASALLRLLPPPPPPPPPPLPRPQRSAFVVASRPERCCQLPEPRRAAPQNKGQFHVILLEKMVSLDATWSAWMPQQPVQPDGTM